MRWANRRFVPFYFDLADGGAAGDPDARAFVTSARPEMAADGVETPPVLFMTAEGKVLGEVSNFGSTTQALAAMAKVLKDHPEFDAPAPGEAAVKDTIARAELRLELQDLDGASKLLEGRKEDRARYLLGRIARLRGDPKGMAKAFEAVKDPSLLDDVRMERALEAWRTSDIAALAKALAGFPKASRRYTEARYYEGLALFHAGRKDEAMETWKSTITACPQDPWIYRADWAYVTLKDEGRKGYSTAPGHERSSPLGRIGYLGRANPDLKGPGND